ncbi:MAG: putative motility protein [Candidatus Accumulibacter sp.]|nr:putative motility protein [Accumulibacter sp.]MBA4094403.1 putative motility protein [Accumulibacter sp.]MBN9424134.1 YjfB family protein [Accumulibacter sp.]OJW50919.1 MAG: hypothetical protein BGO63_17090 [Candidatus Accumulibacter sp. 66-26]
MDVGSVGSISSALSQSVNGDAIGITVLKKAMDIQAQSTMQLLQSLPQINSNNPPHLGNSVNTFA